MWVVQVHMAALRRHALHHECRSQYVHFVCELQRRPKLQGKAMLLDRVKQIYGQPSGGKPLAASVTLTWFYMLVQIHQSQSGRGRLIFVDIS
jgi:hypothetical protein